MRVISPGSDGGLDAETLDALRDALRIAFRNRGTAVNQGDRIRSNGGRRGHDSGSRTGPGTRTNPVDLTATTSSTSSNRSRESRSRRASGGRDGREDGRFRSLGRASRLVTESGSRFAGTSMNRSSESSPFKGFLDSNMETSENLRGDEPEHSESTSSRSRFTAGSHYSSAERYTNEGESLETPNDQGKNTPGSGSSPAATPSNAEESLGTPERGDEGVLVNGDSLAAMWSDGEEGFDLPYEVDGNILTSHPPAAIESNEESLGTPCDGEAGLLVNANTATAKCSTGEQSLEAPDDQVENILTTGHLTEARRVNEEGVLEIPEDEDLQREELGWLNGEGRSMDSEDASSLESDMEPDFLRQDPEHYSMANYSVQPRKMLASQAMRPLMGVVIPVRTKKRTRQEDSDFASKAKVPASKRSQNETATSSLTEEAKALSDPTPHVEEKKPARSRAWSRLHYERETCSPVAEAARSEKCKEAAEAFTYLDALPTMRFTQPNFDPFAGYIICKH